jgi:hypothetical protein
VGNTELCVGTVIALRGREFARRIVTVHPRVPDVRTLLHTSPTNCLIFFERLDELEMMTAANIPIRVLQRSQYDPMDVLV